MGARKDSTSGFASILSTCLGSTKCCPVLELRQSSWNRSSCEDWTDPSLCEEPRQVQGRGCRGPEEERVQVLWQAEDLRQQEVWLHQVEPRRVPGDEGERPPQDRRRQRAVHARAWPPLRLVQDPDGTRWTLSPLKS